MVSGIFIIAAGLGAAFLLGLLGEERRAAAYGVMLVALAFMSWVAAGWVWTLGWGGSATPVEIFTAGTEPPFAINLRMGIPEAALTLLVSLSGFFSALYLKQSLFELGRRAMAVFLILTMALAGIILTRDIFNLFVFFELAVISTGGLVLLSADRRALAAGFKYLIVAQAISILLLIGIIFAYHATGTLNIDGMADASLGMLKGGSLAFFFIFIAVAAELKPFPANGWALDIYESAHPAFSAFFSAAAGAAALYAVDKVLLMGAPTWFPVATGIGIVSFVAANLLALSQTNDRRMLGYSSVGQLGLLLVVLGQRDILGESYLFIAGGILLAHSVAKAGLYWLSGLVAGRELTAWAALRGYPLLIFAFVTFIALLIGLPPFPGFYAKWELIHILAAEDRLWLIALILGAALVEVGYLFRWFGYIIKREQTESAISFSLLKLTIIFAAVLVSWWLGYLWGELSGRANLLHILPLLFALGFLLLERLPAPVKNTLAIAGLVGWFLVNYAAYNPLQMIFAIIILVGGALIMLASYDIRGRRIGFYPSAMLMYAGLAMLIVAEDSFGFFAAWELLTVGSYFLILRGKRSEPHALSYILFSLGGAFLILTGFALATQGGGIHFPLESLGLLTAPVAPWVFLLLAIGFMTKTAAIGVHIWLPGAHAEAETDVSPMVSGILLKAGLFGLAILLMTMGKQPFYGVELTHLLLWIGAVSALLGNLMAIFQEDAKRLLAYSSIGQMGYALFGLAMMNHLGWLMALIFVINHYIYKSMLFLSVGGVAKRTGTREMYRMGGLIALMPLSFIAVLVGIIAISGLPPLSGFGGRWTFYNAILMAEYRLPMVLIFLAGPIAFLYLFRLVHTIFLGQLKDEHRKLREAPFWLLLPQMIYVGLLLTFAIVPGLALGPVSAWLDPFFPQGGLNWEGFAITSEFGYWSPVPIMVIIGVIFLTLLGWLLFVNRKAQKVSQFNIVFAAERPYRPETTHFAWNFFAPYGKALGFLLQPLVTRFWETLTDLLHTTAELGRRFYTGNGQTYAFHFLVFVVVVYLVGMGG
uniref:Formate hydrogenlyase subunit 3/Multisubunit Na+/H+ antiporter, MnhD subunit n=1 Tax=Candidatus Kentrum sp. FM TaxID=2126340 RepID=A0A450SIX1_9GAMM|nr:MAG: Formate hydrogenlyase subunit 3/Multisubunit Na+/H+ antiporter, MnhD subunit [Candidatus Kentron sp. FM]VFJ55384.1 MAG: Formate hydrogenlyase subunit 3/Multisubunit Na+/H+ antiporter, MnhD subunit [Candidatus Kentron sp. FM]VFK09823.1 MAG: Formate hydrogenlyase subunit 3/Multisubunit Na+/H+ antiporter, MnhD subunit [Candidatus Kentron sp. FM]